jgi:hypothetical protein
LKLEVAYEVCFPLPLAVLVLGDLAYFEAEVDVVDLAAVAALVG